MAEKLVVGALNYLGYGLEATKGTPCASINDFLFVTANNMNATPDVIRKMVMGGSRSAERIIRPSKFKIHGTLSHPLYPNSGAQFIMAALGLDTYLAEVSGTMSGVTTANGLTSFTSSSAITPGAWSTFGAGATQEARSVLPDPSGVLNAWVVAALSPANQSLTAFTQIGQHMFTEIPGSNPLVNTLPTLTLEMNEGGEWAWQLAGCHVGTYNMKGGKEDVEISMAMLGTQMPVKLPFGSFTPFQPTTAELADVAKPFTINDGFIIVPNDNAQTGSPNLAILNTIEDWEFDWSNGMLEKAFWDGSQVYKAFPGIQKSTIKYKYAVNAGRPDAYEDYLRPLHVNTIPFVASMAINVGTPLAPAWNAYGVYVPSSVMTKADIARSTNDLITFNVEADALITQAGNNIATIFVANESTTAYTGT